MAEFMLQKSAEMIVGAEPFCVLGFGKLGGRELNFSSDVDLVIVTGGKTRGDAAEKVRRFVRLLTEGARTYFLYRVDLRLRPHGNHGSLFLSDADTLAYYQNEADVWEFQALIKARPVAGKREIGEKLLKRLQ